MTRERLRFSGTEPGPEDLVDVAVDGLLWRCGPEEGEAC